MTLELFPFLQDETRLIRLKDNLYKVKVRYNTRSFAGRDVSFSVTAAHVDIEQTFRAVLYLTERNIPLKPIETTYFLIKPNKIPWSFTRKHPTFQFLQHGKKLNVIPFVFELSVFLRGGSNDVIEENVGVSSQARNVSVDKSAKKTKISDVLPGPSGTDGNKTKFFRSEEGQLYRQMGEQSAVVIQGDMHPKPVEKAQASEKRATPEKRIQPGKRKSTELQDTAKDVVPSKLQKGPSDERTRPGKKTKSRQQEEGNKADRQNEDKSKDKARRSTRSGNDEPEARSSKRLRDRESTSKTMTGDDGRVKQQTNRHSSVNPGESRPQRDVRNSSVSKKGRRQSDASSMDENEPCETQRRSPRKQTKVDGEVKYLTNNQSNSQKHKLARNVPINSLSQDSESAGSQNDLEEIHQTKKRPLRDRKSGYHKIVENVVEVRQSRRSVSRNVNNSSEQESVKRKVKDSNRRGSNVNEDDVFDDDDRTKMPARRSLRVARRDTDADSQHLQQSDTNSQHSQEVPSSQESDKRRRKLYRINHSPMVSLPLSKGRFTGPSPQVSTVRPQKRDDKGKVKPPTSANNNAHQHTARTAHQVSQETSRLSSLRSRETTTVGDVDLTDDSSRQISLTQRQDRYTVEQAERQEVNKLRELYEPTVVRRSPRIASPQGDASHDRTTKSHDSVAESTRRQSSGFFGMLLDSILLRK